MWKQFQPLLLFMQYHKYIIVIYFYLNLFYLFIIILLLLLFDYLNINSCQITSAAVYQELFNSGHVKKLVDQQEWRLQIQQKEKDLTEQIEKGNSSFPKEALEELKSFLPMLDEYAHWLVDNKTYQNKIK